MICASRQRNSRSGVGNGRFRKISRAPGCNYKLAFIVGQVGHRVQNKDQNNLLKLNKIRLPLTGNGVGATELFNSVFRATARVERK